MNYTPFLTSIAETLSQRVLPNVTDDNLRGVIQACIRAIAGVSAGLETIDLQHLASLRLPASMPAVMSPLLVAGPAENLAANDQTAAHIAAAATWLAEAAWCGEADATAIAHSMLAWERSILRAKVAAMNRVEASGSPQADNSTTLDIDRDALAAYLRQHYGRGGKLCIAAFRQMIGGRSRQTAVFALDGDTDLPRSLVVQRDHPANISTFGVGTQYPVLELVSRSRLRTARPVILETDATVLGAPFMVVERMPGQVAGPDYFQPPQSPDLAYQLAEQLAILHLINPASLEGTVASTIGTRGSASWVADLDRIETAWSGFALAPSMTISAALAWMRSHVHRIADVRAIIHNDAAFHNILVEDGRISALLDWELVHIGHPAEDLGYCRYFVCEMADWQEFVQRYIDAGGTQYPCVVLDYFSLRAGVHLLTLLQYGRSMFMSGVTSDINLAEAGTSFIQKHHARIAEMLRAVLEARS